MTPSSSSSPAPAGRGQLVRLTAVLVGFFVVGSAMAFFIWSTLSDFLAGKPVEGGAYLIAMALVGVFVGLAWLLSLYIQRVVPTSGDADGWTPGNEGPN